MPLAASMVRTAKVFIVYKGTILLLRRDPNDRDRPGEYDLPGGGIDQGESLVTGLVREIKEEVGLSIAEEQLAEIPLPNTVAYHSSKERHAFIMTIEAGASPEIILSVEHTEYAWTALADVNDVFPHPYYSVALQYALDHNLFL